jgi:tRNA-dihydrouridine synthase 1
MVTKLKQNLKVPVTCKIRCLPHEEDTLHLAEQIQKAGASLLTVHGRTRDHNKQTVGPANWEAIKRIKSIMKIPVIVNGGISTFDDVKHALAHTGCDGVMSSESILEYPALFDPSEIYDMDELALEYVDFYEKYRGEGNCKILKAHLHKFLHSGFNIHGNADLREKLNSIGFKDEKLDEVRDLVNEMKNRRKDVAAIDKITWYYRHWKDSGQLALEGVKNKD